MGYDAWKEENQRLRVLLEQTQARLHRGIEFLVSDAVDDGCEVRVMRALPYWERWCVLMTPEMGGLPYCCLGTDGVWHERPRYLDTQDTHDPWQRELVLFDSLEESWDAFERWEQGHVEMVTRINAMRGEESNEK